MNTYDIAAVIAEMSDDELKDLNLAVHRVLMRRGLLLKQETRYKDAVPCD